MKTKNSSKILIIIILFNLKFSFAIAQIKVNFPVNRAVFQRNLQNEADVQIAGSLPKKADRVEARFTPINSQGFDDGTWHGIHFNPNQGFFLGSVRVRGGWYKLEVRAFYTDGQSETISVEKVGVGEVFMIAGQSNAQGINNRGEVGASDDRVNCVNALNRLNEFSSINTSLTISQLSQNTNIAPYGQGAWCWGELGDKLAQRYNVPILFFNSGWNGTMSINWQESSQRAFTWDAIFQTFFPYQYPYQNLRYALNYYGSLFGVRAVLWQQGEADVNPGIPNRKEGYNNLKTLIEQSRKDYGGNIPWVVSKTSYVLGATSNEVLAYQQDIIDTPNLNVFQGPSTDVIQIPRPDGVHFGNTPTSKGLSDLANAWNQSLSGFFFSAANPIGSRAVVNLNLSCQSNNQVKLRVPNGYSTLRWNDGSQDAEKNTNNREFFAVIRDNTGNVKYTPMVNGAGIDFNLETPQIIGSKNEICANDEISLSANKNYPKYLWNDGVESSNVRNTNQANTYSVRGVNAVGCLSNSSNTFNLKVNPSPNKPSIINQNKDLVCDGGKITLESSDKTNAISWSNGSTSRTVELNKVADYELQIISRNQFGCENKSDLKRVSIKPNPLKPSILTKDALITCDGEKIRLTSSDSLNKTIWSDGSITRSVELAQIKDYSFQVKSESQFGCQSPFSDLVNAAIKPNPAKPRIIAKDPLIGCEGKGIRLQSSDSLNKSIWTNSLATREVTIGNVGDYGVSVLSETQFGCKSLLADSIKVSIKARPIKPQIALESIFGLKINTPDASKVNFYEWFLNGQKIGQTKDFYYTKQVGNYQVWSGIDYKLANNQTLSCISLLSESLNHNPDLSITNIVIYPNPTKDLTYLESKQDLRNAQLKIYQTDGKFVNQISLPTQNARIQIDLSKYPKGRYVFKVESVDFEESKLIIVE